MRRGRRRKETAVSVEALDARALLTQFTVTTLSDVTANDGETTLREAVEAAEASAEADDIVFALGLSGTITLSQGPIEVTGGQLTITGNGRAQTVIDANGADYVFYHYENETVARLTLRSMTLQNAERSGIEVTASQYGGDIGLTADDVVITGTKTVSAILVRSGGQDATIRASLTVRDSRISGNSKQGITVYGGVDVLIEDSEVSDNGSRGIDVAGYSEGNGSPVATITGTLIDNNQDNGVSHQSGFLLIEDSRISNNTAHYGAGIFSLEGAIISRSSVTGNVGTGTGGGIYLFGGGIANSTISGNQGGSGGGAFLIGSTKVDNSTITGNTSTEGGGGLYLFSPLKADFDSNIIAGNIANGSGDDIALRFAVEASEVSFDHNLLGSNDGTPFVETGAASPDSRGNLVGGASTLVSPGLTELFDVGIQQIHALLSNSPAIDRGSNPGNLASDQIGAARLQGAAVDIGSIEGAVGGLSAFGEATAEGQDGATNLTFSVRLNEEASGAFTVDVATQDGTATIANGDYLAHSETLSFTGAIGETVQVTIQVNGDYLVEDAETFSLVFSNISDGSIDLPPNAIGEILDDDADGDIRIDGGTLFVEGTNRADSFDIVLEGSTVTVTLNDTTAQFEEGDSVRLMFEGWQATT